ncbi:MAG: NAD(P)H-hydrate dehydratase [Candidatus Omnitrophota bacterium]
MLLPAPLSRRDPRLHKYNFGHALIIAGSKRMLGAAALSALSALRSGAGLVTLGIPRSLNGAAHKKTANEIITWPLPETPEETISLKALAEIKKYYSKYNVIGIGPGLTTAPATVKFVTRLIEQSPLPLVIDADALNILAYNPAVLLKTQTLKILTPHPGEMARLTGKKNEPDQKERLGTAKQFAKKYKCIVLLKGPQTVVADPSGKTYVNKTGNVGMATAGSGDVLTGMISAFVAQGLSGFEAAKFGAFLHGKAGDLAVHSKGKAGLIASDIIDCIPKAFKSAEA